MDSHKVVLSPLDQLMPTSYIRVFLVIQRREIDFDAAVEQLQHGLIRVQQQLPYIGGTVFEDSDSKIGIEWEDSGPPPQIQIVPTPKRFPSLTQLEAAEYPFGEVWRTGSPAGRFGEVNIREGLPAVTITCSQLDRYIVLGVSCSHNLWDIAGLSVFLHLWSKSTRNSLVDANIRLVEDISLRDVRLRQSLGARDAKVSTSFMPNLEAFSTSSPADVDSCTLQFDIAKLKALGSRLFSGSGKGLSANDLATAIIWTAISSARGSSGRCAFGFPRLRVLVDGRKFVFQPDELKVPYLGNLALPLFASLDNTQFSDNAQQQNFSDLLTVAVGAMLFSSQNASPLTFTDAICALDKTSNASVMRESSASYNCQQLTSTSWSQAPMYVDFGAQVGKVEYVRLAPDDYKLEGMILTLPRKRDGSNRSNCLEIFIALQTDELQALRANEVVRSLTFSRSRNDANKALQAKI